MTSHNILQSFKCCKTKPFIHYVCIKCSSVFHKSCLHRFRSTISSVNDNKIICCKDSDESLFSDYNDEKSILEKTINELTYDAEIKSTYINKLKAEKNLFIQEAIKNEEETNLLIKKQETMIRELEEHIKELKRNIDFAKKSSKSVGTQTNMTQKTKNLSTSTHSISQLTSAVEKAQCSKASQYIDNRKMIDLQVKPDVFNDNISDFNNSTDLVNKQETSAGFTTDGLIKPKNQILVLADENGKGLSQIMTRKPEFESYSIVTICKPAAPLNIIIENIDNLTKNFTENDFVIIIGGTNDIKYKTYPSFRNICDKLKLCRHTNVILASIPYGHNKTRNKNISKLNIKLREFLIRLNNCSQNIVSFLETHHVKSLSDKNDVANKIIKKIERLKYVNQNLIYLPIKKRKSTHYSVTLQQSNATKVNIIQSCDPPEAVKNNMDGLNSQLNPLHIQKWENNDLVSLYIPASAPVPTAVKEIHVHSDILLNTVNEDQNILNTAKDFLYPRLSQMSFAV